MTNAFARVTTSGIEFSRQLEVLAGMIRGDKEKLIRKVCIDLYSRIAERTPVDTGRARANWSISINDSPEVIDVAASDTTSNKRSRELLEINRQKIAKFQGEVIGGNTIFIYNNLVYIESLENGSSQQAPEGMVAISLEDFSTFYEEEARKLQSFS